MPPPLTPAGVTGGAGAQDPATAVSPAQMEPRDPAASSQHECVVLGPGRGSGRSEEVLSLAQARWKPAAFPALEMPCERRKTCCFSALMLCEGNIPALLPQEKKTFLVPLLSG